MAWNRVLISAATKTKDYLSKIENFTGIHEKYWKDEKLVVLEVCTVTIKKRHYKIL